MKYCYMVRAGCWRSSSLAGEGLGGCSLLDDDGILFPFSLGTRWGLHRITKSRFITLSAPSG